MCQSREIIECLCNSPQRVIGPVLFAIAAVGFFYLSVTEVSGSADLTDTGPLLFFVAGCLFLVVLLMTALSRG